jgi:hypothetical protein
VLLPTMATDMRAHRHQAQNLRRDSIRRRMASYVQLSPEEDDVLHRTGAGPAARWALGSTLDSLPPGHYLIQGWAGRVRSLRNGRRQVCELILPGDPIHPHFTAIEPAPVLCLSEVFTVDGIVIHTGGSETLRITAGIELARVKHSARLMDQIVRLGRQTAYERLAHLFLELDDRLTAVGLVRDSAFGMPLTQEVLGDVLGLSVIHINRTLQLMRQRGVIKLASKELVLLDLPSLNAAGEHH